MQICQALRRYSEREGFVREALFHLFSLTHVMEKPRPDILKVSPHPTEVLPLNIGGEIILPPPNVDLKKSTICLLCLMLSSFKD